VSRQNGKLTYHVSGKTTSNGYKSRTFSAFFLDIINMLESFEKLQNIVILFKKQRRMKKGKKEQEDREITEYIKQNIGPIGEPRDEVLDKRLIKQIQTGPRLNKNKQGDPIPDNPIELTIDDESSSDDEPDYTPDDY